MSEKTVLLVDDEASIRQMLHSRLSMAGYRCLCAENAQQGFVQTIDRRPDLLLLDWMLPDGSGLELARRLRRDERTRELPIIFLTAKTTEAHKITGLESGADDYITKPFSPRELIARMEALLRRSGFAAPHDCLEQGGLRLHPAEHRLYIQGKEADIGPMEYRLLHFFMRHPERVYSRSQLLDRVWGGNVFIEERTVDVHILRLRKALDACGTLVQTVRGVGYRFSTRGSQETT